MLFKSFTITEVINLSSWQTEVLYVALIYVIVRGIAKVITSMIGARLAHMPPYISANVGLTLQSQGGVALGIAFIAFERFVSLAHETLGLFILDTLALTTVLTAFVGVTTAKIAFTRVGENNNTSL